MFIVHLAPNHHCSLSLQQILGLFDPRYLCMVVEALCLPPTYKSHPVHCLYRIRQRHAPGPTSLSSRPIWIESGIADGPSFVVTLSQKGTCLVHCSTMELRTHVCRVKRELRPPMNGVLPGLGSAITYWEGDYFFLTRYLI